MAVDADALVAGGGPAGSAVAALLAAAGWRVVLAELAPFPRDKVCGECLPAGALDWLDALGVGAAVDREAGPQIETLGWLDARGAIDTPLPAAGNGGRRHDRALGHARHDAPLPSARGGGHRHGRALGRARLDALLLDHAREQGVELRQPARVRAVHGSPGDYACELQELTPVACRSTTLRVPVVIDARGSVTARAGSCRDGDLLAFKARFHGTRLAPGRLPLLSFPGGYGGLVVAERGWTTFAVCIGRQRLRDCRALAPALAAGAAVERWLRLACPALEPLLEGAQRDGPWRAFGPVRPGIRLAAPRGLLRVGNAAGESHPLAGEGIAMAIQSAALLASRLVRCGPRDYAGSTAAALRADYARAWLAAFRNRLLAAAMLARIAMHPALARPAGRLLASRPALLGSAARLAGKTRPAIPVPTTLACLVARSRAVRDASVLKMSLPPQPGSSAQPNFSSQPHRSPKTNPAPQLTLLAQPGSSAQPGLSSQPHPSPKTSPAPQLTLLPQLTPASQPGSSPAADAAPPPRRTTP
jgi:flavin-dependent dehydrogenase